MSPGATPLTLFERQLQRHRFCQDFEHFFAEIVREVIEVIPGNPSVQNIDYFATFGFFREMPGNRKGAQAFVNISTSMSLSLTLYTSFRENRGVVHEYVYFSGHSARLLDQQLARFRIPQISFHKPRL